MARKKTGTSRLVVKEKTYTSVSQLVRETSEDRSFVDAFNERLSQRRILKDLMALRAARGLSQQDIAEKLGCTQSRISKLETAADADLRLGDLAGYAAALGLRPVIVLEPKNATAVDRVKRHASRIKKELDNLASLASTDHAIAEGVASFFGEALISMMRMLQDSAKKLPPRPEDGAPYITLEIDGGDDRDKEFSDLAEDSVEQA
jgi:transcriptional regulator with XRE-family HTH domain